MAEQVAFTGFWAALGTATSGFEAGVVAALAAGGLERPIGIFFMGERVGAGAAGGKHSETTRVGFAPEVSRRPPPNRKRPRRD